MNFITINVELDLITRFYACFITDDRDVLKVFIAYIFFFLQ